MDNTTIILLITAVVLLALCITASYFSVVFNRKGWAAALDDKRARVDEYNMKETVCTIAAIVLGIACFVSVFAIPIHHVMQWDEAEYYPEVYDTKQMVSDLTEKGIEVEIAECGRNGLSYANAGLLIARHNTQTGETRYKYYIDPRETPEDVTDDLDFDNYRKE